MTHILHFGYFEFKGNRASTLISTRDIAKAFQADLSITQTGPTANGNRPSTNCDLYDHVIPALSVDESKSTANHGSM